ncbi:MAG: tyrosine kinase DivL, partial [Caulobacteraceae bacterium]|nr:tyrosine kinase DivL [Caulobacteraceae bacterium]
MSGNELILAAAAGAVSLAICAVFWVLAQRRIAQGQLADLGAQLATSNLRAEAAQASAEAFDSTLLAVEDGHAMLASGADALVVCAAALSLAEAEPQSLVNALMRADPDHARRLRALFERGEACAFEVQGPSKGKGGGLVAVEGRAAGAMAWLRLSSAAGEDAGLPTAPRFAALLNARPTP